MERLEFDGSFDLAEEVSSVFSDIDSDYAVISVYGKYDVIKTLLEDLIMIGYSIANEIELEDCEVSNYDKEFVLYVTEDGINVEKAYRNNRYLYGGADISFVHDSCSSNLLKYIQSNKIYEFGYTEECDNEDEKDCDLECQDDTNTSETTYISRKKDGTPTGFQKTWFTEENGRSCYSSFSHYSSDVDMLRDIAEDFGIEL